MQRCVSAIAGLLVLYFCVLCIFIYFCAFSVKFIVVESYGFEINKINKINTVIQHDQRSATSVLA